MTSKIINLNNDNFDPKIKDLFDKASKNGQTNLAIKEFSELVEELTTLPIQNSKITFKTLNHILQDTKYDKHNLCDLSLILNTPFNFLNNKKQLLSFQQVLYIVDYADVKYNKDQLIIAWIYHYFYKKESSFYIEKFKLTTDLKKTDWNKYNIVLSDFGKYLISINNTYYTTQEFINIEKSTGDKLIENFYVENDENENIENIEIHSDIKLTKEQNKAVLNAINFPLSCISGFPGTGKSTIIKCIVDYYNKNNTYCWLMAPTGKAIKDLKIKCNKNVDKFAGTIHRFLYVLYPQLKSKNFCDDNTFYKDFVTKYPDPFKIFIVDEASMISFDIFTHLIKIIIENNGKLILVGDKNQLPPVHVGRPYECILNSNIFPNTELTEIKRTEKQVLLNNIKKCTFNALNPADFDDNEMIFINETTFTDERLTEIFKNINNNYGKFSVITPQHKFNGGVEQCNKLLQSMYNTKRRKICEYFNSTFYVNDVIIQKENDYSRNPPRVNGDVAIIINKIDNLTCKIRYIDDDEERIIVNDDLKDDFQLFYSATVHKFQGSQEDVCVIILSNQHSMWRMENNKKLFYTAISRAKEKCIIIGDPKVFMSLKINRGDKFYSKFMSEFDEFELNV